MEFKMLPIPRIIN